MTDSIPRRLVTLTRDLSRSSHLGTFGELDTGSFKCKSLERPRAGLIPEHPCIPAGEYDVDWTDVHPHHNPCYEIMNVPERTAILVHAANIYEQLLGCIAPGSQVEEMEVEWEGQTVKHVGVAASGPALKMLLDDLHHLPFRLRIVEV